MKINGGCHCGAIAYEAELDPEKVGICHCADCQALSGSAFRTVAIVSSDAFAVTQGTPKEYVKVAESGNRRVQAFCPDCGSGLYATDFGNDRKAYNIRLGTVQQRYDLFPKYESWRRSALRWLPGIQSTRKFGKNRK